MWNGIFFSVFFLFRTRKKNREFNGLMIYIKFMLFVLCVNCKFLNISKHTHKHEIQPTNIAIVKRTKEKKNIESEKKMSRALLHACKGADDGDDADDDDGKG